MTQKLGLMLVAAFISAGTARAANVDFEFTSSLLYSSSTAVFEGTLTNQGASTAYINGDNFTSALPADDTPFLLAFPVVLNPGESATGPVLLVTVPPGTPLGLYTGTFTVVGGDTPDSTDVLVSRTFAVYAVPEPGSLMLCAAGLAAAAVRRLKMR